MPIRMDVATDSVQNRKPEMAAEFIRLILIGVIASVITAFLQFVAIRHIEHSIQAEKDRRLLGLQGVWLLQTHNRTAAVTQYQNLQIQYMAVIAVDGNFNVYGTAYKIREKSDDPHSEKDYRREERTKSTLHGALVQDQLTLLFDTQNPEGLPSFQSIGAVFRLGPNGPELRDHLPTKLERRTETFAG